MYVNEITFEKLPEAVAHLIKEVSAIRVIVEEKEKTTKTKRIPIEIDEACKIVMKAKPTLYTLVRKGLIPCYKNGKKLYFFEEELLEWIASGKKKTIEEIKEEVHAEMNTCRYNKKRYY